MNLIECLLTQSTCYNGTTIGTPVGVLFHDTAACNPWIKRYVQPSDNDPNREKLLSLIGVNRNGNDWNHTKRDAGVNAFIGRLASGKVGTVQSLPWNYRPWGCGSGPNGSCNGSAKVENSPFWIQFEICDDAWSNTKRDYTLGDPEYFADVYQEAIEFTAYICLMFNFNPMGTYKYKGIDVPVITCHKEAHALGLGSGHSDVIQWFSHYNKSMWDIRNAVKAKMEEMRDMTYEETQQMIADALAPIQAENQALKAQLANLKADVNYIQKTDLGKYIHDINDMPYCKDTTRELLDCGAVNGGTPYEVNPDDINLPLNIFRAVLIAKNYTDYKVNES